MLFDAFKFCEQVKLYIYIFSDTKVQKKLYITKKKTKFLIKIL